MLIKATQKLSSRPLEQRFENEKVPNQGRRRCLPCLRSTNWAWAFGRQRQLPHESPLQRRLHEYTFSGRLQQNTSKPLQNKVQSDACAASSHEYSSQDSGSHFAKSSHMQAHTDLKSKPLSTANRRMFSEYHGRRPPDRYLRLSWTGGEDEERAATGAGAIPAGRDLNQPQGVACFR